MVNFPFIKFVQSRFPIAVAMPEFTEVGTKLTSWPSLKLPTCHWMWMQKLNSQHCLWLACCGNTTTSHPKTEFSCGQSIEPCPNSLVARLNRCSSNVALLVVQVSEFTLLMVPLHRAPWSVSAFVGAKVKSWAKSICHFQALAEYTKRRMFILFSTGSGMAWVTRAGANSGLSRSTSVMITA